MQETIALLSSPHFIIFLALEIVATAGIVRAASKRNKVGEYLSLEERKEFGEKYTAKTSRINMPHRFDGYAEVWDGSLRTTFVWLGISTVGFMIVLYKLFELYAL